MSIITYTNPSLSHNSKLRVYRELKGQIELEKYLKYVKGAPSTLFFKFRSRTHELFEELGQHAGGDGSQECCNCGTCNASVHHTIPKNKIFR